MKDTQYIDGFTGELLHINEVSENKLIDLNAGGGTGTYVLTHTCINLSAYALSTAAARLGKTGNTVLLNSALSGGEQRVNTRQNTFEWQTLSGSRDVKALHAFIAGARKDLIARGNNPLFLSVGALKWRVSVKEQGKEKLKDVTSPYLIFPVKLVVTSNSAPVAIEFIDDDVYINPCLLAKLEQTFSKDVAEGLPRVGGQPLSSPVDLSALGDGSAYFNEVCAYISGCNQSDGGDCTLFEFDKDLIALAQYKHDELCTYYDIRRNRDKIYSHPLVERMFEKSAPVKAGGGAQVLPEFVLPRDSVQEDIVTRVAGGESLIIKGPPGTGKTVTIANMLAALLSRNKKVIFASKKISALTEVYAKLPEKLRKFTMLLDSETEANAAKIRPEEIKQDFKRLLSDSRAFRENSTLDTDVKQATAERAKVMRSLSSYANLMFNERCIAGDSFYNALSTACADDLPVIEFADGKDILSVSREQYNALLSKAGEAEKLFGVITGGGRHEAYKSPWFGIDLSCDSEGAVTACKEIAEGVLSVCNAAQGLNDCGLSADLFTLSQLNGGAEGGLSDVQLTALISYTGRAELIDGLKNALAACGVSAAVYLNGAPSSKDIGARLDRLAALKAVGNLTRGELGLVCENAHVFRLQSGGCIGDGALASLMSVIDKIKGVEGEIENELNLAAEVFKSDLSDDEARAVLGAEDSLEKYFENCPQKPKTFDFKAKKAYAALCGLSYLKSPSFKDIAGATAHFCRAERLKSEIEAGVDALCRIFRKQLSEDEIKCIRLVAERCSPVHISVREYVSEAEENFGFIDECFAMANAENICDVNKLTETFRAAYAHKVLRELLSGAPDELRTDGDGVKTAKDIVGAGAFISACERQGADGDKTVKAYNFLKSQSGLNGKISAVISGLENFGKDFFKNYYTICGGDSTLADLKILAAQSDNREALAAAVSYSAIKHNPANALPLNAFTYPFEKGEIAGVSFTRAFEHSFFTLAVRAKNAELGILRNGLGARAENDFAKYGEIEKKLCELNCGLIEGKCLARIKPDDDDYIFIQDRNPGENLRLMFKRHASAILKLKRCLILSPYTASLIFRGDEYDGFDVLIVDEASQLEPALILPVLFRAKQCVIVGDEWQMPPIKHFETLSPARAGDGEGEGYYSLESEISALGLALRNGGFPVSELVCHYRSNTESLIKFSQKLFYPCMRTFPAPVPSLSPAKGISGLGFKDVYVPEGVVCAGKNVAEADRVVEELKIHFDNYYDPKTQILSMPVGVVAFGESQCSLIETKVKGDGALFKKIQGALEKFDDLPEKLIFFKTIETVQGQETGHLILSLTHGRREGGLYMHFGQLNQGKLGRCIFNVAVTRAQNMVTVIHSVRAAEITSDSVSYIKEYLETAERFSREGGGQFVSEKDENGFVCAVADFIRSKGFAPERVVVNYGVTEGSVRIPIAVLDETLSKALLGVWCEKPAGGRYDFLDYNVRYRSSLKSRGWKLHEIYIHDWVDNHAKETQALERALSEILKKEEKK
ncbi:MAG: DUF4011 domain-containing protein [Roseburia sp.]|nr:DUF4011 domain-containing protein [Roseburia sp.]